MIWDKIMGDRVSCGVFGEVCVLPLGTPNSLVPHPACHSVVVVVVAVLAVSAVSLVTLLKRK